MKTTGKSAISNQVSLCLCLCSNTFFTGSKCGRAVGSHANLSAGGQGAYGGQSPL